jgi:hypothetical protein
VRDDTPYLNDLGHSSRRDDVLAARQAVAAYVGADPIAFGRWVGKAGPLPNDPGDRALTIDAVGRGLAELENLFNTVRWR